MGVSPLGKDSVWEINLAARVAWMSFLGDLTQSEIGKRLGLSPARVHRLILLAREKGLVRISIEGRPAECLNMEAELAAIQCPVLSFWGVDDEMLPASGGNKITRACKVARHVEVAGCGHWVMVEHTRMFNAACLDFLAND